MDIMGDIKLRQPPKTGNIGNVVTFKNRHLAKAGNRKEKNRNQVDIMNGFVWHF
jgi:hypothetical protein